MIDDHQVRYKGWICLICSIALMSQTLKCSKESKYTINLSLSQLTRDKAEFLKIGQNNNKIAEI